MYLWDANILRHFAEGQSTLNLHLSRIKRSDVALLSVVVAEVLRGRCEYALKATQERTVRAHQLLIDTYHMIGKFQIIPFDETCADVLGLLCKRHSTRKRYADMQIAAMAVAGNHILITRNTQDFIDIMGPDRLQNWIDNQPK